jgi:hypothetical protein
MRRNRWVAVVIGLVLAGCGGSAPATPTAIPIKQLPPNVALNGTPLGDGGQRVGDYAVWLTSATEPGRGDAQLEAVVLDKTDQPVTDATVSFDIDMTNMSHGKNVLKTDSVGRGHYVGSVYFMMGGPWRVIVVIEQPDQAPVRVRFNFDVK